MIFFAVCGGVGNRREYCTVANLLGNAGDVRQFAVGAAHLTVQELVIGRGCGNAKCHVIGYEILPNKAFGIPLVHDFQELLKFIRGITAYHFAINRHEGICTRHGLIGYSTTVGLGQQAGYTSGKPERAVYAKIILECGKHIVKIVKGFGGIHIQLIQPVLADQIATGTNCIRIHRRLNEIGHSPVICMSEGTQAVHFIKQP